MKDFDWRTLELEKRNTKRCDHFGCDQEGLFPAPKNIHNPKERFYFCLEHVKAYNEEWDYVDQVRKSPTPPPPDDAPHNPFTKYKKDFTKAFTRKAHDPFHILNEGADDDLFMQRPTQQFFSPKTKEGKAFLTLELSWPFTEADLKMAYKTLAKKHHPDLNPDDPTAIDRFRAIKEAYELLHELILELNKFDK